MFGIMPSETLDLLFPAAISIASNVLFLLHVLFQSVTPVVPSNLSLHGILLSCYASIYFVKFELFLQI